MSETVLDRFVVLLRLDTKNFDKGRKDAVRNTKSAQQELKGSTDALTESLKSVGGAVAAMLLGFDSIRGGVKMFADLNTANAQLGRTAANLGSSVHELDTYRKALELLGGSAEGANDIFAKIAQADTEFKINKTLTPFFQMLQQLGVAAYDGNGGLREKGAILEDLAKKLQRYDRATAHNLAAQGGVGDDLFNYLALEDGVRGELLKKAEAAAALTERQTDAAQEVETAWKGVNQQLDVAKQSLLGMVRPSKQTLDSVASFIKKGNENDQFLDAEIAKNGGGIRGFLKAEADGLGGIYESIQRETSAHGGGIEGFWEGLASLVGQGVSTNGGGVATPSIGAGGTTGGASVDNNPGNIRAGRGKGFRTFGSLEEGIRAAKHQIDLYRFRDHLNTLRAIISTWAPPSENNTEAYIADVAKSLGIKDTDSLSDDQVPKLLQAMFRHEHRRTGIDLATVTAALAPTPGAGGGAGGNTANTSNVSVGTINVHTAATDADGIAATIGPAIQRKNTLSQANTGQVP